MSFIHSQTITFRSRTAKTTKDKLNLLVLHVKIGAKMEGKKKIHLTGWIDVFVVTKNFRHFIKAFACYIKVQNSTLNYLAVQ